MDKIISGKYLSYLFDEQISEGRLSAEECLIYMKMLIYCEAANCQRRKLHDKIGSFPFFRIASYTRKKSCWYSNTLYLYPGSQMSIRW